MLPGEASLEATYDFIRMLDAEGYPHAFVEHGGLLIRFTDAQQEGNVLTAKAIITSNSPTQRA